MQPFPYPVAVARPTASYNVQLCVLQRLTVWDRSLGLLLTHYARFFMCFRLFLPVFHVFLPVFARVYTFCTLCLHFTL